ncbi:host attachment family protein [Rhodopseudomonas sp. P2A-2r]|uniref:host attachment family protein n=1 Tax=unclassified Rhodopseudomonas TaxID=2638247 RepID=UPI0022340E92|nr:host attachment protein [Rhodopseudomonas sp. P2A-2r]UZE49626.1 host attachment protein [Rhodopseudomonas sp. P2A-2r]
MILPTDTIVAVADGEKLNLFRNTGTETEMSLVAAADQDVEAAVGAGGTNSSSANPDQSRVEEDGFATGIVAMLNQRVLAGKFSNIVIIAAPKTLGEMRKHYHKKLEEALVGEIAKDLTGHSIADIEKSIHAA